jgi:hypothetical protein
MFHLWRPQGRLNLSVRIVVPEDLRELVGQIEIVRTLGTSDKRQAKRRPGEVLSPIAARIEDASLH